MRVREMIFSYFRHILAKLVILCILSRTGTAGRQSAAVRTRGASCATRWRYFRSGGVALTLLFVRALLWVPLPFSL